MEAKARMPDVEKEAIFDHITDLQGLNPNTFPAFLVSSDLVSLGDDLDNINSKSTHSEKIFELLRLVGLKQVPRAFEKFLEALEKGGYDHIAKMIQMTYESKAHPCTGNYVDKKIRIEVKSSNNIHLGIHVGDGKENPRWTGDRQLYILKLDHGQPAMRCGRLMRNDTLHKINGHHVSDMTVSELNDTFEFGRTQIESITVKRRQRSTFCL